MTPRQSWCAHLACVTAAPSRWRANGASTHSAASTTASIHSIRRIPPSVAGTIPPNALPR